MFFSSPRNKFGSSLAAELTQMQPAGQASASLKVVIACTDSGLRTLRRNHKLDCEAEALPFAVADLSRSEISRLAQDRGILTMDKESEFASIRQPVPIVTPAQADVYRRYKTGPLQGLDGDGVRIMVQDSGFSRHPDISAKVSVIDLTGEGDTRDQHGHGTAIASQFLARGPYPGLVPQAELTMARIFDRQMTTRLSWILKACSLAMEKSVHIVSMSYGGAAPTPIMGWALKRLHGAGITLFAAAGNSGPGTGTLEYPGGYPDVIAVAAVTKDGRTAPFSSRGNPGQRPLKPDLAVEGVNIVMARSPDGTMGTPVANGYIMASGTSFACPIAAALGAMVCQAQKLQVSPEQIRAVLQESTTS
jgi:subtilisin family serine protease